MVILADCTFVKLNLGGYNVLRLLSVNADNFFVQLWMGLGYIARLVF